MATNEVQLRNRSMEIPLISVILPVYNGERFLGEAIESILNQSFRNFEFIVINDGSTDSSASILDSYQRRDPRLLVYHQENRGLVESLNRGCGLAQGRYIARMDSDDISVKNRLDLQLEFMDKHPDVGVLGGAVEIINTVGTSLRISVNPMDDKDIRLALLSYCAFWHPTVIMRKEIFELVGGYRKALFGSEDHDLWLRFSEHSKLANLETILLYYRLHRNQITVAKIKESAFSTIAVQALAEIRRNGLPDPINSIEEITPTVLTELGISESKQQAILANRYLWSINTLYDNKEFTEAFNIFTEMLMSCDWKQASKQIIADIYIASAKLQWKKGNIFEAIISITSAVITRPIIMGRPLKLLLHWLRKLKTK